MLPLRRLLGLRGGQLSFRLRWRGLLALVTRWALLSFLRTSAGTASHRPLSCSPSRRRRSLPLPFFLSSEGAEEVHFEPLKALGSKLNYL